jgi:glycosyltransferase involved in cell wall biosynthesis
VASDIPGTRDLVTDGETGYLAPLGDRTSFARYVNRLLDDRPLAESLGQAARRRATEQFGVQTMIDRYADLYRTLLA